MLLGLLFADSNGLSGVTGALKGEASTATYQKITAEEAKSRIDSGDALVVLDVRTKAEYEAGHIPGAVLLPNEHISSQALEQLPDLEAEILVYCRSGNRSAQAAKKLIKLGYTDVYDFGGIIDWPY
ncbi:MAG: rhodanese-like domain-containing protein, partial [Clostridiales bacterium]|nr:rhodanese-like domain-containing protein [Clostridiales bacterium]